MNATYIRNKIKTITWQRGEKASPSKPGEGTEVAVDLQLWVDDVTLKQPLRKGRLCIPACLFQVFALVVVPPLQFSPGMCQWRWDRVFSLQPPQHWGLHSPCWSLLGLLGWEFQSCSGISSSAGSGNAERKLQTRATYRVKSRVFLTGYPAASFHV